MALTSRKHISLYEEAKAGLNSLVKQTAMVGAGFLAMLLLTGGNPPGFVVGLSVCLGIAFVAWSERKRFIDSKELHTDTLKGVAPKKAVVVQTEVNNMYQTSNRTFYSEGNFGIGVNKGEVHTENFAVRLKQAQQKRLAEAAAEIQQLLRQLEQSYPIDTTTGKMIIATEAIKHIESDPALKKRVLSALKAGGVQALAELLDHPAASFVIAALQDWQRMTTEDLL
ncbi:hypothetical protein [Tolypothrix sp. VBCCA 56010]|uniref:hypothetical protein n=1 Tax=Tolypothrix sp. VBCCA 56010 TaxID=3137731 RepID=UPI003D7DB0AF